MVAKVISGKSIAGVIRYNEKKVAKGYATQLCESLFGSDATDLTFGEKVQRFALLTRTNKKAKTNAVHISLNFAKEDLLSPDKLQQITKAYMSGIGFEGQPYLVYEHFDSAHPHVHIVTTCIREDGSRINLHNIGREKSEPTRKEIEQSFGLIPAESRKSGEPYLIQPIDLQRIRYGEVETKAAISSVVREVVRSYRFTNLSEFRAALEQFGVTVEGGKPGSRLYDKRGIIYSLLDESGMRTGIPIKASDIYTKPTIKRLEPRFTIATLARQAYKDRLKASIDKLLSGPLRPQSEGAFIEELAKRKVHVHFQKDENGRLRSLTYVDNTTRVVFGDKDLGGTYTIDGIRNRLKVPPARDFVEAQGNREFVDQVLETTDFTKGLPKVIAGWVHEGMILKAKTGPDGITRYWLGRRGIRFTSMTEANNSISTWLRANRVNEHHTGQLALRLTQQFPAGIPERGTGAVEQLLEGVGHLASQILTVIAAIVEEVFRVAPGRSHVPYHFIKSTYKKKQSKRRGYKP